MVSHATSFQFLGCLCRDGFCIDKQVLCIRMISNLLFYLSSFIPDIKHADSSSSWYFLRGMKRAPQRIQNLKRCHTRISQWCLQRPALFLSLLFLGVELFTN